MTSKHSSVAARLLIVLAIISAALAACGPRQVVTQSSPVASYVASDTSSAWTHMRIFILRDSTQLAGLSAALDAAGVALEPDSAKRRARTQYGATLRDAVGSATYGILP